MLIPERRRRHPGATVLMDNLSAHKPRQVESTLTGAGFRLLYLPRYSPDLPPIEPGWSKLKSALRTTQARTRDALETALAPALDRITPTDARTRAALRAWNSATAIGAAGARTRAALETALAPALDRITPADARGWFNHCGYAFPEWCENRSKRRDGW